MPVSFKIILLVTFMYLFGGALGGLGIAAFIQKGNWLILLFSVCIVLVGTVLPSMATVVAGKTRVLFLGGKRQAVYPE